MKLHFFVMIIVLSFYGCKTAEDLRREKLVEELSTSVKKDKAQLGQSQRMIADMNQEITERKRQVYQLQSQLDEDSIQIKRLEGNVVRLEEELRELTDRTSIQHRELQKYLNEIVANLKKISKLKMQTESPAQTQTSLLSKALDLFKNGKYTQAKPVFLQLLKDKTLERGIKNRVYHNLGIMEFSQNNCDQSMLYFTKLFSEDPKSAYCPNALLHMGRCFKKMDQIPEAKAAYQQIIEKYSTSSRVSQAQEELSKL